MNVEHLTFNVEPRLGVVAPLRDLISIVLKNPISNLE
jgi:hypothetical protein